MPGRSALLPLPAIAAVFVLMFGAWTEVDTPALSAAPTVSTSVSTPRDAPNTAKSANTASNPRNAPSGLRKDGPALQDSSAQSRNSGTQGRKAADSKALPPAPSDKQITAAMQRGIAFLLEDQNPDGSWGSARRTKGLNIYAPVPGAHHAFRAAVTAMCVEALIACNDDRPEVRNALSRGERWLLQHLPEVRRATPQAVYNNWTHAYAIQALVAMYHRKPHNEERRAKIRDLIVGQIDMLRRYECISGGWAYYDFNAHTKRPSGPSISFVTATVLIALHKAGTIDVDIPDDMVRRAIESIHRQRKPDFSYCYGEYLRFRPMHPINRPGGSLGRSQVCNLAMYLWDDPEIDRRIIGQWLDRLFDRHLWLDIGRKRPVPHESWFAVAGYFFYYGHYYAAGCIEQLEPESRSAYRKRLARVLLARQEEDGSWWDFPFYDYHQPYGTAFALMSLASGRN